ncbi:MAG: M23 family metallopeptidase [Bacilli bacterium]|nr:M23 family metallopeptidase [Bacilli bacterium]
MTKRKIKKSVVCGIYAAIFVFMLGAIYLVEGVFNKASFHDDENNFDYVSETIIEDDVPVVNTKSIAIRPYTDAEVTIKKDYYDYKAESEKQENSILYYENTYIQNSGVAYGGKDNFDVVSILDGTVVDVKEDELLGKIVQIKHDGNVISVYQSLSTISVKKGDTVTQGQSIGKSGTSNISKDLGSHLHFELIIKGNIVNPEEYYDKNISEL